MTSLAESLRADLRAAKTDPERFAELYARRYRVSFVTARRLIFRAISTRQKTVKPQTAERFAKLLGTEPERYLFSTRSEPSPSETRQLHARIDDLQGVLHDLVDRVRALEDRRDGGKQPRS